MRERSQSRRVARTRRDDMLPRRVFIKRASMAAVAATGIGSLLPEADAKQVSKPFGNGQHITGLEPLTLYTVTVGGVIKVLRMSSSQGSISFDWPDGVMFELAAWMGIESNRYEAPSLLNSSNHVQIVEVDAPVPGETVSATELRIVVDTWTNDSPGKADYIEFYCDDALLTTIIHNVENDGPNTEFATFKGRCDISRIAPGNHVIWARAHWVIDVGTYSDSPGIPITIETPNYGQTIMWTQDEVAEGAYRLIGSANARVRVIANGHKLTGSPSSVTLQYVDFYNLGATTGFSTALGADPVISGALVVEDCRFDGCTPQTWTQNGSGTCSIRRNVWRSNSRVPTGQYPDGLGGAAHGSFPAVMFNGNSSGAKVFAGNNIGAGWAQFSSQNWTVGGDYDADTNIAIGPRCGFFAGSSFTGWFRRNYGHHQYPRTWSQGACMELWDSQANVEHSIVVGGSWPMRGADGEIRYNLIGGWGWTEGDIWAGNRNGTGAPNIHHNLIIQPSVGRGRIYATYGLNGAQVRNNTFDGLDKSVGGPYSANTSPPGSDREPLIYLNGGSMTLKDNLFLSGPRVPVYEVSGTITADYNAWYDMAASSHYYPSKLPTHDASGDPKLGSRPSTIVITWDRRAVWKREAGSTVREILASFRTRYTPRAGSVVIDAGDRSIYGSGNDIGAIGAGAPNPEDKFGTLTPGASDAADQGTRSLRR